MVLAKIDVWEVAPPFSVKMPNIFSLSICTVSDGNKSLATRIDFSVNLASDGSSFPVRIDKSLRQISMISSTRSLKYGSFMLEKWATY